MSKFSLNGLVIRTATVISPDAGFIYACDPKKEELQVPHAITIRWAGGEFATGECNYDAHSACVIAYPEPGLVDVAAAGYYSVNTKGGLISQDIFECSQPDPDKPRSGGIRAVAAIAGKAYAVGIRGMVYRLDDISRWTRIDNGLPDSFNAQAISGFDEADIYVVGRHGELWHFNGAKWRKIELPTNKNLTAIKCAGNGVVYIAGYGGMLVHGRNDTWEVINHDETEDDFWDVEFFKGNVYLSTMSDVFLLVNSGLNSLDFGSDSPDSCYQLSVAENVMWSSGEFDVMAFDGAKWTRVI